MPMALRSKPREDITNHLGTKPVEDGLALPAVEVLQEAVERRHPLAEAAGQLLPFVRRDQPGEQVHGPDALGALLLAVHGEGDPLTAELVGYELLQPPDLGDVNVAEPLDDPGVDATDRPVRPERLVEGRTRLVAGEQSLALLRQRIGHDAHGRSPPWHR